MALISAARTWAIFRKEIVQMRRDRLTFGMMFALPIVQLILFGYAINTDPRNLPTALLLEDRSPYIRSMIKALETSDYFEFVLQTEDPRESGGLLASGDVAYVISFPADFTQKLLAGRRPQVLIEADAADPSASSAGIAQAANIMNSGLRQHFKGPLAHLSRPLSAFDLIVHNHYNPEGKTSYNIVPGLLGVLLTMTLVMITSMAMTKEAERGTMENLLAMPAKPVEVMIGKIAPYIGVGAVQTIVVLIAANILFGVPFVGSAWTLVVGVSVFVVANLAVGFTFSTIAKSQMQAMQLTFFFFLPSMLLSGFMFPFRGMPDWAQFIGEGLPLTQFLRIVRGVMLKDASLSQLQSPLLALLLFTTVVAVIAMHRYRRTLD
ncbi:MAG: ABC transporter permease [Congregibacter sp.]